MCLMCGAEHDAAGYKTDSVGYIADFISAEVKPACDSACPYAVCTAESRHAGCRNEIFAGHLRENHFGEHGFRFRIVKCLADDVRIPQKLRRIVFRNPDGVCFDLQIRCDFTEIFRECLRFADSDLIRLVLLTVEIGDVHPVKVDQQQLPDSRPCECNGDPRSQSTQPADCDNGRRESAVQFCPVPHFQCPCPFFIGRYHSATSHKADDFNIVAVFENRLAVLCLRYDFAVALYSDPFRIIVC